jgi:hypothetical protein
LTLFPASFGSATGILKRAQDGSRLAGALVAAGVSLPIAPLIWVIVEGRSREILAVGGWLGGFALLGFLMPRVFTFFLRVLGSIADILSLRGG